MATPTRPPIGEAQPREPDPLREDGAQNGVTPAPSSGASDGQVEAHAQRPGAVPGPAPGPAAATGAAGHGSRSVDQLDNVRRPRGRRKRLLLLVPILLVAVAAGLLFGYRYWYESTYFVITDNAQVTGDLVQVGSMNAGRIVASRLEIGAPVRAGQELAVVAMPQQVGSTVAGAAPRMDVLPTSDTLVSVQSPTDGVIAARTGFVGSTVAAGQPIYMIVDPRKVWIKANIEESKVWMVRPGQRVTIHVDALNREMSGRVQAITPASAATFSLLPSGNVSGNFTKVTQYVPVKIAPDEIDTILPLGTSVTVKIEVRQPTEEYPMPWRP